MKYKNSKYNDVTNPTIQLPSVMKIRENNYVWEAFGNQYTPNATITIPINYYGDIELTPLFKEEVIIVANNSEIRKSETDPDTYNCITFDMRSCNSNIAIFIKDGIEHIIFRSDSSNRPIQDVFIEIESNIEVSMDMINCNFIGKTYIEPKKNEEIVTGYVIEAYRTHLLNIYLQGDNILRQRDWKGNYYNPLCAALMTLETNVHSLSPGAKLKIYGGNGVGNVGINGIDAGSAWVGAVWMGKTQNININAIVEVTGGNGTDGISTKESYTSKAAFGVPARNGGHGGNGGFAGVGLLTDANINVGLGYLLTGYSGTPGQGGTAGHGEEGANAKLFGPSALPGGNGGNGGNGGVSSAAITFGNSTGSIKNENGKEGRGFSGGNGGLGGKPLMGDRRPSGTAGKNGITYEADIARTSNTWQLLNSNLSLKQTNSNKFSTMIWRR